MERFAAFCAGAALNAHRLYILGDLFDVWLGDDQLKHDPAAARVAQWLSALASPDRKIFIQHGNRDFLLGETFARTASVTLIDDPTVVDLDGVRTVLTHGDLLCTDDRKYQNFRRHLRQPSRLKWIALLPYGVRAKVAALMRRQSQEEQKAKPAYLMDVNQEAVLALARQFNATRIIHGHTHQPATHTFQIDGKTATRIVLPDWREDDDQGHYLEINEHSLHIKSL
jgi:UDP-2,3-diacylglucosamine hydrolase